MSRTGKSIEKKVDYGNLALGARETRFLLEVIKLI